MPGEVLCIVKNSTCTVFSLKYDGFNIAFLRKSRRTPQFCHLCVWHPLWCHHGIFIKNFNDLFQVSVIVAGARRVLGWQQSLNHTQRKGASAWRRYPHIIGVWARGQEVTVAACTAAIHHIPHVLCKCKRVYVQTIDLFVRTLCFRATYLLVNLSFYINT